MKRFLLVVWLCSVNGILLCSYLVRDRTKNWDEQDVFQSILRLQVYNHLNDALQVTADRVQELHEAFRLLGHRLSDIEVGTTRETLAHRLVLSGNNVALKKLIELEGPQCHQSVSGDTPLCLARVHNNPDALALLLSAK